MTREEAKKFEWFRHDRNEIERHIDKIYDDFESRICRNCEYISFHKSEPDGFCNLVNCLVPYYENFGCNKFKRVNK